MDDPIKTCTALLGQSIQSIEIDPDGEIVKIHLNNAYLEFTGDDLEFYVESPLLDS